jgi:hypothetical protein
VVQQRSGVSLYGGVGQIGDQHIAVSAKRRADRDTNGMWTPRRARSRWSSRTCRDRPRCGSTGRP